MNRDIYKREEKELESQAVGIQKILSSYSLCMNEKVKLWIIGCMTISRIINKDFSKATKDILRDGIKG